MHAAGLYPRDLAETAAAVAEAVQSEARSNILSEPREPIYDDGWPNVVEGMTFGPRPDEAALVDGEALHYGIGAAFAAPVGAQIVSSDNHLILADGSGVRIYMDSIFDPERRLPEVDIYLRESFGRPLAFIDALRRPDFDRNGPFRRASAQASIETPGGPVDMALYTFRAFRGDRMIRVLAIWARDATPSGAAIVARAMEGMRPLEPTERGPSAPARLRLAIVEEGQSVAMLIAGSPVESFTDPVFRAINGLPAGARPIPGALAKIVTP